MGNINIAEYIRKIGGDEGAEIVSSDGYFCGPSYGNLEYVVTREGKPLVI